MGGRFQTTRWSLVVAAAGDTPAAREALGELCRAYWYPLYAFIRRQGHDPERARDLTQSYFVYLMESSYLERARPDAGKFRAFLLVSLKHFLANERTRELALKRRADSPAFQVSLDGAEDRYRSDAARPGNADEVFERRWAATLMARAFERLAADYETNGRHELYDGLKGFLTGTEEGKPYSRAARELSMTEGAVKVAVHRMRQRLGVLLRNEVSQTVRTGDDVDDELRHLLRFAGSR